MSENREMPPGWQYVMLGDVFDIERGGSPRPIKDFITDAEDGINWIKIGDTQGITKYIFETKEKISPEGVKKSRMVYEDDFILSNSMSFGRPYIMKTTGCIHDGWLVIRTNKEIINTSYLYYILSSSFIFQQFSILAKGSTVKNLNIEAVKQVFISLPPLLGQHRIVAKIEELFSELDKGVEALKTAQQQLKVYRQAVLNSAITGDTSKTIEEVVVSLDQGWSPKCYNEPSGNHQEWGVIKTTAIQAGHFQEMENKRLPENLQPRTQHELKKGDLLITRAGPRVRVGICCLVKNIRPRLLNCDKVYRMRTNIKVAIPEYIEILFNSPKYSREIERMKTGISDSGVNLTQKGLLKIVISLPSIEQQTKIVQEIETRLSVADKLEETITQSLLQAEALRQSILKKAFAGKLVPQDPNDEPAAKLLERIKAERAAPAPVKGTVRGRGKSISAKIYTRA